MSYQPFPITEFKTGLYNYLQPWIRPIEAFEPLENAYIYRGVLQRREGYAPLGLNGQLPYEDFLTYGNGGTTYSGTLPTHPILAGSFTPTDGVESFTDNGLGILTGSMGGSGTINYTSGAWTLTFNANVGSGVAITATYRLATARPVMGLKLWRNESTDRVKLIACDTRRAWVYNDTLEVFDPINSMSQILWIGDNSTTTIDLSTGFSANSPYTQSLVPFTIQLTDGTTTITDNGSGGFTGAGNFSGSTTVNYGTGVIHLVLNATTTATIKVSATLQGDYFTGNYSNFFNETNWQGFLFLVNNKDQITTFDGVNLGRRPFSIDQSDNTKFINNIGTCLDVDVYKNRFIVQRPTIVNSTTSPTLNGFYGQSFRWSALNNPNNLVADVAGNGGELSAPTDDFIQSSDFLRDQLVVGFTNSFWTFRFTGSDFNPFRWDKINSTKSCNAAYASVSYDQRITFVGSKGLVASDGANVDRYDISIIDEFEDINQNFIEQCFAQRFDSMNHTWLVFPLATDEINTPPNTGILLYNFIENTWATHTLDVSMSCLGIHFISSDATWADFGPGGVQYIDGYVNWKSTVVQWDYFLNKELEPSLIGGGSDGIVYQFYTGSTDNGQPFYCDIISTQWNPFIQQGQKVIFGYIDFYYIKNDNAIFNLTFYTDNTEAPTLMRTLTLDGPTTYNKHMKRIYLNISGEFLKMEIQSTQQEASKILGMILWATPAGRLTP